MAVMPRYNSFRLLRPFFAALFLHAAFAHVSRPHKTCVVTAHANGADDAPAILAAFERCGNDGNVVFLNETYHVNSVMNTTGLKNCEVDLYGTLVVCVLPSKSRTDLLIICTVGDEHHLLAK